MTDWEIIPPRNGGRRGYCYDWLNGKIPMVAFTKAGLTFNAAFAAAFFNPVHATGIHILYVKNGERKIGIKPVSINDPIANVDSHLLRASAKRSQTRICGCKEVVVRFPDAVGHAYRAHADARGLVIEVEISPENMGR